MSNWRPDPTESPQKRLEALERRVEELNLIDASGLNMKKVRQSLEKDWTIDGNESLGKASVGMDRLEHYPFGAADIDSDSITDDELNDPTRQSILAMPKIVLSGTSMWSAFMAGGTYWMPAMSSGLIAQTTDTNLGVHTVRLEQAALDAIPGYKPQVRLYTIYATNTVDPGTQTFDVAISSLISTPGTGAGGANNRRFQVSGLLAPTTITNMAASQTSPVYSAWVDYSAANLVSAGWATAGQTNDFVTLAMKATVTPAANALLSCEYQIELRYIPV